MESNGRSESLRDQLEAIERGEVSSWVVCPPTPVWWAPGFGLWAAALTLAIGLLDGPAQSVVELGLVVVMLLLVGWDRRRRGTYPQGLPPRELRGAVVRMILGAAVVAIGAWLLGLLVGVWAAAVVAGLGTWAVVAWYEREYSVIAERIRERLA